MLVTQMSHAEAVYTLGSAMAAATVLLWWVVFGRRRDP